MTHCGFEAVSVSGGKYPRLGDFFHQLPHRFSSAITAIQTVQWIIFAHISRRYRCSHQTNARA